MGYRYLIFDVDGTLLDFGRAYASAQKAIAEKLNAPYTPEYISLDEKLSWKIWGEFGLDNTSDQDIQANYHCYYYSYLQRHFTCLAQALGQDKDIEELVECYLEHVALSCDFMEEDTFDIYRQLSASHKLVLATNGVTRVQRPRVEKLLPYTEAVFISEEIGCIKPGKTFFKEMLVSLRCSPEDCLMVGDSLSSDIAGAVATWIPACWYNPRGKQPPQDIVPAYIIRSLRELEWVLS